MIVFVIWKGSEVNLEREGKKTGIFGRMERALSLQLAGWRLQCPT